MGFFLSYRIMSMYSDKHDKLDITFSSNYSATMETAKPWHVVISIAMKQNTQEAEQVIY